MHIFVLCNPGLTVIINLHKVFQIALFKTIISKLESQSLDLDVGNNLRHEVRDLFAFGASEPADARFFDGLLAELLIFFAGFELSDR